ncbi:MAG: GatB/YqeY domain-containing protein [Bacilli bacterium]|nr:GatB/YqeY domain-containing protein [Bacilli bacterium]
MLIDELQKANIAAMKAHDTNGRAVLSVVISAYKAATIDARTAGKEIGDSDLVRIIQKTIKELDDERVCNAQAGRTERVTEIDSQKALISKFLPTMMSEEEIRAEIAKLEDKSIPSIMKHFKANFNGKADMGLVNKVARSL